MSSYLMVSFEKEENSFFTRITYSYSCNTVDEQIYSRCPTVVVSTADKIARLPLKPELDHCLEI
jgi:hypothetical protein